MLEIYLTKMKIRFKLTLIFIIVGIIIFLFGSYSHELVHQIIYRDYDVKSNIVFTPLSIYPFRTIPQSNLNCQENLCRESQEINEAIQYNSVPILYFLYFGFIFLIFILENFNIINKEIKEKQ